MANKGDIRKSEIQPVFPKNWKAIPFKEGLDKGGKYPKLNSSAYLEIGAYPIIDQGEKFIAGYTNEEDHLYDGELPVVIFGDHTRNIKFIDFEFAVGADGTKILKPKEEFDPRFFYYYLKALKIPSFGYSRHFKVFEYLDLPIPSLPEQQRIVARLDAIFGHLDILKEKLVRIPELLKNFRQQVLTQAVTGDLTKEWRGETQTRIDGPFEIPKNWVFKKLSELSKSLKYGSSSKSLNEGEVPVLRMGNLQNGEIDWTDLKYSVDKHEIEKYLLKEGDVLFNRTNSPELVGKTSIFRGGRKVIYAGYLIKIETTQELDPEFLNYILNSYYAKKWCLEVKTDGVSQSNINAKKLGSLLIPKPRIEEQKEIVKIVDALFKISDKIESQYQSLKTKIDQLPQAVLAKAFRGELVSHDQNDNPGIEFFKGGK